MNEDPRLLEMIEKYLEGTLVPGEEAELADLLGRSPGELARFRELLALDRFLAEAFDPEHGREAFRRALIARLRAADGGPSFREGVLARIRGPEKAARRPSVRRFRRWGEGGSPWPWLVAAAGLVTLAGGVFLATRPRNEGRVREVVRPEVGPSPEARPEGRPQPPLVPSGRPEEGPKAVPKESEAPAPAPGRGPEAAPLPGPPAPRVPGPEPAPPPPAPEIVPPPPPTVAFMAVLEKVQGEAWVLEAGRRQPARPGLELIAGVGIQTGNGGSVVRVRWRDGTTVEAGPQTLLDHLSLDPGKRVVISSGTLEAEIPRQPADAPMAFVTPHAEARVLGTRLKLSVENAATRVEVFEGRVRLVHPESGRSVDVTGGQAAAAGRGMAPAVTPLERQLENLALGRPVKVSSVFEGRPDYTGDKGNDGDLNTIWASQGNADRNPWWQVDLGSPCRILRVELVARQEPEEDQPFARRDFMVLGLSRPDQREGVLLASHGPDPFPHRGTWSAEVRDMQLHRYVRVLKRGFHFTFAEFRVFGLRPPPPRD